MLKFSYCSDSKALREPCREELCDSRINSAHPWNWVITVKSTGAGNSEAWAEISALLTCCSTLRLAQAPWLYWSVQDLVAFVLIKCTCSKMSLKVSAAQEVLNKCLSLLTATFLLLFAPRVSVILKEFVGKL